MMTSAQLSKRQSPLPTSVLLRTTLTRTIKPHCYPRVQTIYCISICMAPLQYVYVNIFNVSTGDKRKKKCIAFLNLLQPFWNHWWSLICSKSHHFLLQIASFSEPTRMLYKKKPIRFQGVSKVANQIGEKWKTKSMMWQILQLLYPKLLFFPPKKWMNLISNRLNTASIKYLNWLSPIFRRFQNGCNKVVVESSVVQFWSKIILMITNRTCAALSFDFEITHHSLSSITIINNWMFWATDARFNYIFYNFYLHATSAIT